MGEDRPLTHHRTNRHTQTAAHATRRFLEKSLECNCVVLEQCASVLGEASSEMPPRATRR